MLEETATVIAVEKDAIWVEAQSRSSCSQCSSSQCTTSVVSKLFGVKRTRFQLQPIEEMHLSPGEQVVIGIPDQLLVRASVWAYLLPLTGMIFAVLLGISTGLSEGQQSLLAITGLAIGFGIVHWKTGKKESIAGFQPQLLRKAETIIQPDFITPVKAEA